MKGSKIGKMILTLIIAFIIISSTATIALADGIGYGLTVHGWVRDVNTNVGIGGATVTVSGPGVSLSGLTYSVSGGVGYYQLSTATGFQPENTYTISVSAIGYQSASWSFVYMGEGDLGHDFTLTPLAAPTVANFHANKLSGQAPLTVQFTDDSTGTNLHGWSWNFGDGTSTDQNPTHTYATPGTYTVSLSVMGDGGDDTETKEAYITVTEAIVPVADFSGTPLSGTAPLTVQFTDLSTNIGSKEVWSWDFGDGATLSGNYPNPTHTYTSTGTFTVKLVIAASGDWTVTKNGYITVSGSSPTPTPTPGPSSAPIAEFTATPTSGTIPLSVQFTDESTGAGIATWSWNFGDGSTSIARNPSHTYTAAGTYTVMLTVTGTGGSDIETKVAYITVTTPGQPTLTPTKLVPVVNFTGTPRNGTAPLTVQFTDLSTNNPTSWNWSFGDGNYSNSQNPLYNYTAAGNYTVSLTASNGDGSGNKTVIDYIVVFAPTPSGDGPVTEQTNFNWWWLLLLLLIPLAGIVVYYYGFVKNK